MFPYALSFLGLDTTAPEESAAIRHVGSGTCLDVARASQSDGAQARIWDRNGQADQRWTRD